MTLFPEYSNSPSGSAILLSVKPRYADLIVAGSKRVEFRRAVPALPVGTIALYSSSPVQAIIALVDVTETIEASPTKLWELAKENGGGLTRAELRSYFESKTTGFAFMLENVRVFDRPVEPKKFFKVFTAPQSFKYLTENELRKLVGIQEQRSSK
ncbi:ASCH domain-containing protein [Duganella sp. HH105]|uniref:ASCH domain-containing protein n=1 Tax=Duganella sp. HH105 TaxID=1781067 RepID=UPI00090032D3|nr:ASCH domain-containing protein [Duganella sp. HH105]